MAGLASRTWVAWSVEVFPLSRSFSFNVVLDEDLTTGLSPFFVIGMPTGLAGGSDR